MSIRSLPYEIDLLDVRLIVSECYFISDDFGVLKRYFERFADERRVGQLVTAQILCEIVLYCDMRSYGSSLCTRLRDR